MHVRDGDHQNFRFQNLIDDAVWESSRLAATAILGVRMPRLWKLFDSFESSENFQQKLIAKTRRFDVVILDRLIELLLSDVEKANLHLTVLRENFFERDGFQSARFVRCNAIFDFTAPQCINGLIGLIQTGEKFIGNARFVSRW